MRAAAASCYVIVHVDVVYIIMLCRSIALIAFILCASTFMEEALSPCDIFLISKLLILLAP